MFGSKVHIHSKYCIFRFDLKFSILIEVVLDHETIRDSIKNMLLLEVLPVL